MKLHTPLCPDCGEPAKGTLEHLTGRADFDGEPGPGVDVDYGGWTEIWWDEQRTVLEHEEKPESPENRPLVCCPNGHTWPTAIDW
ncbi:MAG: hypothetical protein JXQ75_11580 [Phycisphaerae bacterium]|nr:hypothetical protein [Phycisphaerae bacterium]